MEIKRVKEKNYYREFQWRISLGIIYQFVVLWNCYMKKKWFIKNILIMQSQSLSLPAILEEIIKKQKTKTNHKKNTMPKQVIPGDFAFDTSLISCKLFLLTNEGVYNKNDQLIQSKNFKSYF